MLTTELTRCSAWPATMEPGHSQGGIWHLHALCMQSDGDACFCSSTSRTGQDKPPILCASERVLDLALVDNAITQTRAAETTCLFVTGRAATYSDMRLRFTPACMVSPNVTLAYTPTR
jgi:hypothetical protein